MSYVLAHHGTCRFDERTWGILLFVADAQADGRNVRMKDFLHRNRFGSTPTVRGRIDDLLKLTVLQKTTNDTRRLKLLTLTPTGKKLVADFLEGCGNMVHVSSRRSLVVFSFESASPLKHTT